MSEMMIDGELFRLNFVSLFGKIEDSYHKNAEFTTVDLAGLTIWHLTVAMKVKRRVLLANDATIL